MRRQGAGIKIRFTQFSSVLSVDNFNPFCVPMSRPVSPRISEIESRLVAQLEQKTLRPGERFVSSRELAVQEGVSYQTAHRLLAKLCEAGFLERRIGSGTYLPGGENALIGADLFLDVRARRSGSFGARLLASLGRVLERDGVPWRLCWSDTPPSLDPAYFPVIWQFPEALARCMEAGRGALLINERPPPGLDATLTDSVSIDDFFGGVCAAQLLLRRAEAAAHRQFCVLSGPRSDPRSQERSRGFLSVIPKAAQVVSEGWFLESGRKVAAETIRLGRDGIFCANDRLAEAVLLHADAHKLPQPPLIGFDDAPIAASLNLTTIAIPWTEMIADIASVILLRVDGDPSAARQHILTPHPVIRGEG